MIINCDFRRKYYIVMCLSTPPYSLSITAYGLSIPPYRLPTPPYGLYKTPYGLSTTPCLSKYFVFCYFVCTLFTNPHPPCNYNNVINGQVLLFIFFYFSTLINIIFICKQLKSFNFFSGSEPFEGETSTMLPMMETTTGSILFLFCLHIAV